jgi:hypothetical protein
MDTDGTQFHAYLCPSVLLSARIFSRRRKIQMFGQEETEATEGDLELSLLPLFAHVGIQLRLCRAGFIGG